MEVVAEPGSGKTLGYLAPIVAALHAQGHSAEMVPDSPPAVILVPTRFPFA